MPYSGPLGERACIAVAGTSRTLLSYGLACRVAASYAVLTSARGSHAGRPADGFKDAIATRTAICSGTRPQTERPVAGSAKTVTTRLTAIISSSLSAAGTDLSAMAAGTGGCVITGPVTPATSSRVVASPRSLIVPKGEMGHLLASCSAGGVASPTAYARLASLTSVRIAAYRRIQSFGVKRRRRMGLCSPLLFTAT